MRTDYPMVLSMDRKVWLTCFLLTIEWLLGSVQIDDFETFTLDKIKDDLSEFGEIEQVNALQDKSCAFVNFVGRPSHL